MGRSGDVDAILTFLAISLMCDEGLALGLPAYFCTLYDGAKSLTPHCTPVDDWPRYGTVCHLVSQRLSLAGKLQGRGRCSIDHNTFNGKWTATISNFQCQ